MDDSANSAAVEAAKGVAVAKLGVPADAVKVLAAETQVVAGGQLAVFFCHLCLQSAYLQSNLRHKPRWLAAARSRARCSSSPPAAAAARAPRRSRPPAQRPALVPTPHPPAGLAWPARRLPAGTNYKLKLRVEGGGGTKYYEAKIWGGSAVEGWPPHQLPACRSFLPAASASCLPQLPACRISFLPAAASCLPHQLPACRSFLPAIASCLPTGRRARLRRDSPPARAAAGGGRWRPARPRPRLGTKRVCRLRVPAPSIPTAAPRNPPAEKLPAYGGAMELTSLEEISAAQVQ